MTSARHPETHFLDARPGYGSSESHTSKDIPPSWSGPAELLLTPKTVESHHPLKEEKNRPRDASLSVESSCPSARSKPTANAPVSRKGKGKDHAAQSPRTSQSHPSSIDEVAQETLWIHGEVLLPLPIDHPLTYAIPAGITEGALVQVPFGKKTLWGVVWAIQGRCPMSLPQASETRIPDTPLAHPDSAADLLDVGPIKNTAGDKRRKRTSSTRGTYRIRASLCVHAHLWVEPGLRHFIHQMAQYTVSQTGAVCKLVLPNLSYDQIVRYQVAPDVATLGDHPVTLQERTQSQSLFRWRQGKGVQTRTIHKWIAQGLLVPSPAWHSSVPYPESVTPESSSGARPENVRIRPSKFSQPDSHSGEPVAPSKIRDTVQANRPSVRSLQDAHPEGSLAASTALSQGSGIWNCAMTSLTPRMHTPLELSPSQSQARQVIQDLLPIQKIIVLEGVTGSGKTEVLLSLCQTIWDKGQQVLVLLPEILLSSQWKKRAQAYFDVEPEIWHSGLADAARTQAFDGIVSGQCPLIIGARSALFLPYARLGMIIVDEEHESGYKQTEGLLYHGRDMAVLRGHCQDIPVLLSSATPSLETRYNASTGRYGHVRMGERFGCAALPPVTCIDMRPHPPKDRQWISPPLRAHIQAALDRQEQGLLFLNRRGYACVFVCFRCQYRAPCPQCSTWLGVHQKPACLMCHYCGHRQPIPTACPSCDQSEALVMRGPGIERIAEEAQTAFPHARTALISSDHMTSPKAMQEMLARMAAREIDLLVGTQIIAKGHHFPYLTTIGIIDTDFALEDMDFRSRERLFQMLGQVSGRAGRGHLPGHAYLQTLQPHHPLFAHLKTYDWDGFVATEMALRQVHQLPPLSRMAAVTLSDKCPYRVEEAARKLHLRVPTHPDIVVLGPAPAPLNPLRGLYRWRFIVRAPRALALHTWLIRWTRSMDMPSSLRLDIDRDPYVFL